MGHSPNARLSDHIYFYIGHLYILPYIYIQIGIYIYTYGTASALKLLSVEVNKALVLGHQYTLLVAYFNAENK